MSGTEAWPNEVIDHATRRNLTLIVGAGISASCVNDKNERPPKWSKLVLDAASAILVSEREAEINELVSQDRLLEAAELLKLDASNRSRLHDLYGVLKNLVDGTPGHAFAGSAWHEAIVRLEARVIATTNYDKIIERATDSGYTVHDYSSTSFAADIRRNYPVLMKLHGTVDKVEGMVLSRKDYSDVRRIGAHAMEVMHALLLTRPALLIGYRLHDPDLQLILENIFGGRSEVPAHYMLAADDMPDYEKQVLEYSYGVNVITYPAGDYDAALEKFEELAEIVAATPIIS